MNRKNSVHLQDFPKMGDFEADMELIDTMDKVRAICSCALFVRDKNNLRVRLPLNGITVITSNTDEIKEFSSIIADEINVKKVDFIDKIDDYGEKKLVLNFQKIGSKVGTKMPNLIKASKANEWKINKSSGKLKIEGFELEDDEYELKLEPKKSNVFPVENYDILIMLDLTITKELEYEGMARDLVRTIQQLRKNVKLNVSDRIDLVVKTNYDFLKTSIEQHKDYIKEQTLSTTLNITKDDLNCDFSFCEEIDKNIVQIGFSVIKLGEK